MSKRNKRSRAATRPKKRVSTRRRPQRRREPDLIERITDALDADEPLELLELASTLLDVVDRRSDNPFSPDPDRPTREQLLESLFAAPLTETSALLTAVAVLARDDVLRRRVSREIAGRAHALPEWLAGMSKAAAEPEAVEVTHPLGDGDDVLVSVALPGGHALTAVVLIEHNLGSIVKDAFVVPGPLDEIVAVVRGSTDPDLVDAPLSSADAKVRITDAVAWGARTLPPAETETWPACRPLVEWMTSLLPDGGTGYERPEWPDEAVDDLARRFRASPFAAGVDDPDDLLSSLLWFGTDYGPGDPMRWSPTAVEILLLDWIPRKIVADVEHLTRAPDVLRAFIRFCHHERGIRPGLTEETVAAVDDFAPEYQQLIRSDRLQGPDALLAAMGVYDGEDADPDDDLFEDDVSEEDVGAVVGEIMLDTLRDAVGGEGALDRLDTDPLPDEPFAWDSISPDVHARVGEVLDLVERACAELLDDEYRTACRRLLADVAAGSPEIFRRRRRPETAAAVVCWIVGKANALFEPRSTGPRVQVKQLMEHFGLKGAGMSQRSDPLLRAIGADPRNRYGSMNLGTPRYLTGARRAQILDDRERFRAMAD